MFNNLRQHTALTRRTRQPTPARVHCGHGAALGICQQDGQAVSHHHGASHTSGGREAGIGHGAVGRVGGQGHAPIAVYLVQKHRSGAQVTRQQLTVVLHGGGVVVHMGPQVKAVERGCRHTASTCGHERMHACRHRPVRYPAVQLRHGCRGGVGVNPRHPDRQRAACVGRHREPCRHQKPVARGPDHPAAHGSAAH